MNEPFSYVSKVQIGFIRYDGIGLLDYGPKTKPDHTGPEERSSEYIIAGAVVGALVLIVLALIIVVVVITRKKRRTSREKDQLLHQMENLEASVSRQCREGGLKVNLCRVELKHECSI